jgi:hypothetical protein
MVSFPHRDITGQSLPVLRNVDFARYCYYNTIGTNDRRQTGAAILLAVNACIQNALMKNEEEIRRIWEKLFNGTISKKS